MTFIRCDDCGCIHESAIAVCPGCGRCPGCGDRRIDHALLEDPCPKCNVPYCKGCGRCHDCGTARFLDLATCSCGHPKDSEKLADIEESFTVSNWNATRPGCVGASSAIFVLIAGITYLLRFTMLS